MQAFLKKNWKGIAIILLITGLVIFTTHLFRQNAINKKKAEVAEHNLQAANDTIRVVKDRAGKDETNKLAFLTNSVNNLAKLNQELAAEVKNIKGNVQTIIKGEVQIKEVPVPFIVRGELVDSTVITRFRYDTTYSPGNFRKLSGFTSYNLRDHTASGQKEQDEIGISFVTGIKDLDKGKPTIFLKSDYPGFQVTNLQGAEIDPKLFQPKKKVPLITPGITIGWTPLSWDNKDQNVKVQPGNFGVTAGLSFNILKILGVKK